MDADRIASLIASRVRSEGPAIGVRFDERGRNEPRVACIDDVLPHEAFSQVAASIVSKDAMLRRRSIGERKFVQADTASLSPVLGALVRALASETLAETLADALHLAPIASDPELYNGGVALMAPADFMRPHLDNSHSREGTRRRRLALIYYCAREWRPDWRGGLRIWRDRASNDAQQIEYKPNRLVMMEVGDRSWHSVDPVAGPADRMSITTYFYDRAPHAGPIRLTRFSGWPNEPATSAWLDADFYLRSAAQWMGLRKFVRNRHINRP